MRIDDIPFAIRLSDQENWGVTREVLERILQLDPSGSFIALDGTKRRGLTTTISYGKKLAWIGNVIVERRYRGMQIGRTLVQHAVHYLRRSRIKHIALYCFNENVRFYRSLGFVRDVPFVRLRRNPRLVPPISSFMPHRRLSLAGLLSADEQAFGADRSKLIRMFLKAKAGWYVGFSRGSAAAYFLVKEYRDDCEFGPWVCIRPRMDEQKEMLSWVLSKTAKKPIEVSCLRANRRALSLLKSYGFRVIQEGYRMYLPEIARMGDPEANFALGFLDKG
jgi:ribosomal protein S18 acetylase RimI-like enzyme